MQGTAPRRLEIVVSGRVQGVWFRAATREQAARLGLRGWVRNLPDGRVQAVFEGGAEELEAMLSWCRVGPPGSRVEGVETVTGPATGEFAAFSILR